MPYRKMLRMLFKLLVLCLQTGAQGRVVCSKVPA